MKKTLTVLACFIWLMAGFAWGQQASVETLPPSVVNTVPQCGDIAVDAAATRQITVRFSKEMMQGSWTWAKISAETFPLILGEPRFQADGMTCVADVELKPGRTYAVWLNSEKMGGFKDLNGNPAVPYLLVFHTKGGK